MTHSLLRYISISILTIFFASGAYKAAAESRHIEDVSPKEDRYSPYDGIDVSSYQRDIDWETVSRDKNIQFVYIKATEGSTYTSPHFETNIEQARKHRIKVGSYHFLRATSSLQSQFDNFVKSARKGEQDIVPLIDMENKGNWTRKQLVDSLQAFANMLEEHYGCTPMIYTSSNFYNSYLWPFFNNYPLFIAKYSPNEPELKDGATYILWQYSDNGSVQGIDGHVDLCKFNRGNNVKMILCSNSLKGGLNGYPNTVEPNMDMQMRMQTPSKFKTDFEKKRLKEIEKKKKDELKRQQKEEKEKQKKDKKNKKDKNDEEEEEDITKYSTRRRSPANNQE